MADNQVLAGRSLLTRAVIATVKLQEPVPSAGQLIFPEIAGNTWPTESITLSLQKFKRTISANTQRGATGTLQSFTQDVEKTFVPPYFRDYVQINNQLTNFISAIGTNTIDMSLAADFVRRTAERVQLLIDMQKRTQELMRWQVAISGVINTPGGYVQDFQRKAASMIDVNTLYGKYWDDGSADIYGNIIAGCNWLKTYGYVASNMFKMICGQGTIRAILNNTKFGERAKYVALTLDEINSMPEMTAEGLIPIGKLSCDSYVVYLYSYPAFYEDSTGTQQSYLPDKYAILLPIQTQQFFGYGAVPQLININTGAPMANDYQNAQLLPSTFHIQYAMDTMATGQYMVVSNAGMPILAMRDQIYTMQTLAS